MKPGWTLTSLLPLYYAATAIFVLLDLGLDINVRVAFLEQWPVWRAAYYLACFGCLAMMLRWPDWREIIGGLESLLTLVALILSMGIRSMAGGGLVDAALTPITLEEIVNFLMSGSFAYFSWVRGSQAFRDRYF